MISRQALGLPEHLTRGKVRRILGTSLIKSAWYSRRLGGKVYVGRGSHVRLHADATLALAPGTVLFVGMAHDTPTGAVLRVDAGARLEVSGKVQIMRGTTVHVRKKATLTIGAGTYFNDDAAVHCYDRIDIGARCAIARGVRIMDSDVHNIEWPGRADEQARVVIGDDCWIGMNALVLKGSRLGAGSVVAAAAVVSGEVPPRALVAGVPAKVVRDNITWTP